MLHQFCSVFDALFPIASNPKLAKQYGDDAIECGFVDVNIQISIFTIQTDLNSSPLFTFQSLYKSFGAAFGADDCIRFDALIKRQFKRTLVEDTFETPATSQECPCSRRTLFDYFFDLERNVWLAYDWIVPEYVHNSSLKYNEIFVPTVDAIRINHILNQMRNVSFRMILQESP